MKRKLRENRRRTKLRRRILFHEQLEARQLFAGDLVGVIYHDVNENGARDQGEDGLANWSVFLDSNENGNLDTGELVQVTNKDGEYQFRGLAAGNYRVAEVIRDAWTPTNPASGWQDVVVADGKETKADFLNAGQTGTGAISGNVWKDLNNNGEKDPEDVGIAGWTVFIDLNKDTILDPDEPFAVTDGDGNYLFTGLLGGTAGDSISYEVQQLLTDGWEPAAGFDENYTAEVVEGETFVGPDFANSPVSISGVSGRLWNDLNGDGALTGSEPGLRGWEVFADLNRNGTRDVGEPGTNTSASGFYQIYGIDPGSIQISVTVPSTFQPTYPSSGSRTVVAPKDGLAGGVDLGFKERTEAAIGGTIFVDRNENGSRDPGEEGLPGITVFIDANNDGILNPDELSVVTNDDLFYTPDVDEAGSYRFEALAGGTYVIRQLLPDELNATPANESSKSVTVGPTEDLSDLDGADQYRPSEIHGIKFEDINGNGVRDDGEPGIEGVTIYIDLNRNNILDADEPTTLTGTDGSYQFVDLASRAYVVREVVTSGWQQTAPDTKDGILWPEGTSNVAIGNVDPTSIDISLAENETHSQAVSLTLPNTGALTNLVDVFLLFDDTGSFRFNSPIVRDAFPNIISQLQTRLPGIDLGFGVGRLEEYGSFASEYSTGRPFILNQPIISSSAAGYTDAEVQASIQAALNRETPGYGGDGPETVIEALYQMVTGAGFDGNNNGSLTDSGAAGLASTQLSPGSSGDVPAFSSFTADPSQGVLAPSGTVGGAGFRSGALPIIITATDIGFAFQEKGDANIVGVDGLTVPKDSIAFHGRGTTPFGNGAGIQETVTGLNALGALVIGLGTSDSAAQDPRIGLEALASLTGAINRSGATLENGTTDAIAPGDPFYFKIGSGGDPLVGNIADGIVAAIEGAVTSVNVNLTLRASDPTVDIHFNPESIKGLGAGDTATFDVTFTGDGRPHRFDLQFVREGTDVVLGSIPVVIGTPIAGDGYEFEDYDDGEIGSEVNFGNQRADGFVPNQAPSFSAGSDQLISEDAGPQTVMGWASDITAGPATESWQTVDFVTSVDAPGLFAAPPAIANDGTLTYTPAENAFGTAIVSIYAHDDGGTASGGVDRSATHQLTITIQSVNDAPIATEDSYAVDEDNTLDIASSGLLSNDTDIDGDALQAELVSGPNNGSLILNADGTFTYIPQPNWNGDDVFVYQATDGMAFSTATTVHIQVRPVNDAPVALPDAFTLNQDTELTVVPAGVLANDSDIDSPALTAILVDSPLHGALTLNSDGSLTYLPDAGYYGEDSFTYQATDGELSSAVTTVRLTVDQVSQPEEFDFLVVDQSRRRIYEYDSNGVFLNDSRINKEDEGPRGLTTSLDGQLRWTVDRKGEVFIYDATNQFLGSWEMEGVDKPEGIAIVGNDLWIVDRGEDRLWRFENAVDLRRGKANPSASFRLARENNNAMGLASDGTRLWVVNNGQDSDSVFVYSQGGDLLGHWEIDSTNMSPTGISVSNDDSDRLWVVDANQETIFEYAGGMSQLDGALSASNSYALQASNRNPQGLAILSPPSVDAVAASLVAPPSIFDTNDDGVESALDALAIINYLNRIGFEVDPERYPESVLLDLDHSGKVEPQDALRIINRQNRRSAEGENHDRALEELLDTDLTGVALLRF